MTVLTDEYLQWLVEDAGCLDGVNDGQKQMARELLAARALRDSATLEGIDEGDTHVQGWLGIEVLDAYDKVRRGE